MRVRIEPGKYREPDILYMAADHEVFAAAM
jgi:hypothetical protein